MRIKRHLAAANSKNRDIRKFYQALPCDSVRPQCLYYAKDFRHIKIYFPQMRESTFGTVLKMAGQWESLNLGLYLDFIRTRNQFAMPATPGCISENHTSS